MSVWPPVGLAPMAGYTGAPLRLLCRWLGAGLVYTELISAEAATRDREYAERQFRLESGEHPVAVQLAGSDPARLGDAAAMAEQAGADLVDLNLGCPASRVTRSLGGAALAAEPRLAESCLRAMAEAVRIPVTAKLRAGQRAGDESYLDLAVRLEQAGAAALALHGRSVQQGFAGRADWCTIASLVEVVRVPVLGNGDVRSARDVMAMMRQTGCAGVLIGRAGPRNPWVFAQARALLEDGLESLGPSCPARLAVMLWYVQALHRVYGERDAVSQSRTQLLPLSRGLAGAAALRRELARAGTLTELRDAILRCWAQHLGDGERP